MFEFVPNLWTKHKVNCTQPTILGDCDETRMRPPSDTTALASANSTK